MKGYKSEEIKDEVIRISTFVSLQNDLKTPSKNLSGGMKRRVCFETFIHMKKDTLNGLK